MHITFDRRDNYSAVRAPLTALLFLNEWHKVSHRTLHDARALHNLGKEHLAGAKQVADNVHAIHERPFNHLQRTSEGEPGLFGILDDEIIQTLDQRMLQTL